MKKLALTFAVAGFLAMGLSSCNKTCTCTTTSDFPGSTDSTFEAEGKCSDAESTVTSGGYTTTTTCE